MKKIFGELNITWKVLIISAVVIGLSSKKMVFINSKKTNELVNFIQNNLASGYTLIQSTNGIGLFNWFMKQTGTIKGYTGAIWTGVTTVTLAKAMEQGIKENLTGLYNLVNNESISKYELLKLFNHYFKNDELEILPNNQLQLDKSLRHKRTDFSFVVPSYEEQIKDMKQWVIAHPDLYPHYSIK